MSFESYKLKKFNDLGLSEVILRAVAAEGYETPTPIQVKAIPTILGNQDMIGIAQTGTGKTASFVLPLLNQIVDGLFRPGNGCCSALILAPTRELAMQIEESIKAYSRYLKITTALLIGGVKSGRQVRSIAPGVDIVIATPGRLEDLEAAGALSLQETSMVVLDEADQMLDLGFMPAIRRIMEKLPRRRQTVLLSATMPKEIRGLASSFLVNPIEISVSPASKPIDRIDQSMFAVAKADKRQKLVELLKRQSPERAIVFTRTKHGAYKLAQHLEKADLRADAIHGNKSQSQRQRALAGFRSGDTPVLVATDIAARGIDVSGVSHVFNFDLPNVPEAYVHRIGRTARAGASGIAISFCAPEELDELRAIEKLIGRSFNLKDGTTHSSSPNERQQTTDMVYDADNSASRKVQAKAKRDPRRRKPLKHAEKAGQTEGQKTKRPHPRSAAARLCTDTDTSGLARTLSGGRYKHSASSQQMRHAS